MHNVTLSEKALGKLDAIIEGENRFMGDGAATRSGFIEGLIDDYAEKLERLKSIERIGGY